LKVVVPLLIAGCCAEKRCQHREDGTAADSGNPSIAAVPINPEIDVM
jgi:hypothetical protein